VTPKPTTRPAFETTTEEGDGPPYTDEPEDPEPTEEPEPTSDDGEPPIETGTKPSDQITLNPPTATISWGKRDVDPPPTIGLGFPTYSIVWPKFPLPTATVTWGKRQDDEEPIPPTEALPEDPVPEPTEILPGPQPDPSDEITLAPPTATVSWGKRDVDPPPTIGLGFPTYTMIWPKPPKTTAHVSWGKRDVDPPPTIGLGFPTYTMIWPKPPKTSAHVSWGKRQEDEVPEPTEIAPGPQPDPSDAITIAPPVGTVTWGKRDAAPEPTAAPELLDVEARAAQFTCGSYTTVTSIKSCPRIGCRPPCVFTPEDFELAPDAPWSPTTTDIRCPIVKTATNKCATCQCPTTFASILPTPIRPITTKFPKPDPPITLPHLPVITKSVPLPSSSSSCAATVTQTIVSPCPPPPICPHNAVACTEAKIVKREAVVEKRVVQVETTVLTPTPVILPTRLPSKSVEPGRCTGQVTKGVLAPCPTYTCVPWNYCGE